MTKLDGADIFLICFTVAVALLGGILAGVKLAEKYESANTCACCQNIIAENADTVYCNDGRKFHAGCYLQQVKETK